jgi:hypothetical protein
MLFSKITRTKLRTFNLFFNHFVQPIYKNQPYKIIDFQLINDLQLSANTQY